MMQNALAGQQVLILGLGASGLAMALWCARAGARVTVADTRDAPPQLAALRAQLPDARFIGGPFDARLVVDSGAVAVFRSPGLSPAQIAPVVVAARAQETPVAGELSLFSQALAQLKVERGYAPAVLAVTGTNGKTTVTSLAGQLVLRAGKTVAVAGNIGPTLLDTLAHCIADDTLPEVWVLELSSFQLDGVTDFDPAAAVVLNISQDHLDWHGTMAAYSAAKARVFGSTGLMVLNRDDAGVMALLPVSGKPNAGELKEGRSKKGKTRQRAVLTIGSGLPDRPGDLGIETVNGMRWLVRANDADESRKKRDAQAGDIDAEPLQIQRLIPADALRIRGRHNALNALAALALAGAAGCPLAPMLYGLREYRGEPHRVELIARIAEVDYFDDSKGTNVGATVAALQGLGEADADNLTSTNTGTGTGTGTGRKVVLILGGDGKGQDFAPLAAPVARHARAVVLIGRDAPLLRAALAATGIDLFDAGSMQQAVTLAAARARSGDAVLMSPACASFDMFRDYGHRAEVFRAAVQGIADEAGLSLELAS